MTMTLFTRRAWLAATIAFGTLAGCAATPPAPPAPLPVVFVHGNGDSAALWQTTLWRFESNGWPRERLFALDLPNPTARDDDRVAQPGRSSAAENAQALAAEIARVRALTGAPQVLLVGNSRGGLAIRHVVQHLGGADTVARAVLGGTPNHGVWAVPGFRPNNEFNGAGPYLQALNAPKGAAGDEATPGVAWLTLRSDGNDKFAQPDGRWIGAPGVATNVGADGPALKGATNLVLPGRDHRELSYHAEAFAKTYAFLAGRAPATTAIEPEARPVLDGVIQTAGNQPIAGATVEVYAVDAATGARTGAALHTKTTGADGRWGPFETRPDQRHEFVVAAPGYAITHVFRSPFPRSSRVVHVRPERIADADRSAAAIVLLTRPRGYFGLPRDRIVFDGAAPPGVPPGVAGVASSKLRLEDATPRAIRASFASGAIDESLVGTVRPLAENRVVVLELTP